MNIDRDLKKHSREFATALRNHQYEKTEGGEIFFPKQGAIVSGVYTHNVNGLDERSDSNIVVTEGMNHMLDVVLHGTTAVATWYFGLFSANYTPVATLTAATFASTTTEINSATEGYGTSRIAFVEAAASAGSINNTASKAAFTFVTATSKTVWGAGLLSSSTGGGTAGTLLSAAQFSAARTLYNTDVFNLGYTLTLTST